MQQNELSAMTMEQLLAAKKKTGAWLMVSGWLMAIVAGGLVYYAIRDSKTVLLAGAIGSSLTLLPIAARVARIKEEIKKRGMS